MRAARLEPHAKSARARTCCFASGSQCDAEREERREPCFAHTVTAFKRAFPPKEKKADVSSDLQLHAAKDTQAEQSSHCKGEDMCPRSRQ